MQVSYLFLMILFCVNKRNNSVLGLFRILVKGPPQFKNHMIKVLLITRVSVA